MKGNAGGGVEKGAPSGGPSVVRPTVYTVYTSRRDPCRRGKKNNFFGGALRVSPECVHNVHFADTAVRAGVRDAHGPVQSVPGRCTRCTRSGAERAGPVYTMHTVRCRASRPVYTTYTVRCRASRAGVHDVHSPERSPAAVDPDRAAPESHDHPALSSRRVELDVPDRAPRVRAQLPSSVLR